MQTEQQNSIVLNLVPKNESVEPKNLSCYHCQGTHFIKRRKDLSGHQVYLCKLCGRTFTDNPNKFVANSDIQAEYEKDIWDIRNLGIKPNKAKSQYKINFTSISQRWLQEAAKEFVRYSLATISFAGVQARILGISRFSDFLSKQYPSIDFSGINRIVLHDFLAHLVSSFKMVGEGALTASTRCRNISALRIFFEFCNRSGKLPIPARQLIYDADFPKRPKALPRYMPEEVITQLVENLNGLIPPIRRMTQVLIECGMRISELCLLDFNCLIQDGSGDWFLRYYQNKMKKEITIPISREIVAVIQMQQRYIREHLDIKYQYLFCGFDWGKDHIRIPKPSPMKISTLPIYLNKLAKEKNICDGSGTLWHFQAHQFRHTLGTRMINNGVPQHIIQRFLGHETPEMTATYAYIHDKTLKKEIEKFHGKIVNIAGNIVKADHPEVNTVDMEWFKRSIQAQALPNGSCALPSISQGCPHANACLTCSHFRTTTEFLPEHKAQLAQTEKLLEKARANNWVRQVEMNEKVAENLSKIITGLEKE